MSPSSAAKLVDLVLLSDARLWHTPAGDAYVSLPIDGHLEHHAISGLGLREWLARQAHEADGMAASSQAISDAVNVLSGHAKYSGPCREAHVRVARLEEAIYIDLSDPDWRAVEITAAGWSVIARPPVCFRRSRRALPLSEPTRGTAIDALRDVMHVETDEAFRLIVGWLVGALNPSGPFPVLGLTGEQGAGKSTAARIVRRLIDPHTSELRAEPKDVRDLMIAAANGRVLGFDNLSHIDPWLSDALCRISTGGALTTRQLYSDGDEFAIEAIKPVLITSVTPIMTRGDLLDRSISIDLPVLPESARRREVDIWLAFDTIKAGVLGAVLDGVVSALARQDDVMPEHLPRMADFSVWTYRAESAWGWPAGSILSAYRGSREASIDEVVSGDPVAVAVRALTFPWIGTADRLLKTLTPGSRPPRGWPETPRGLAAALRRLAPLLRTVGIEVVLGQHREPGTGARLVRIERLTPPGPDDTPGRPSQSSPSSQAPDSLVERRDGRCDANPDPGSTVTPIVTEISPDLLVCDDRDGCDANPGPLAEPRAVDALQFESDLDVYLR